MMSPETAKKKWCPQSRVVSATEIDPDRPLVRQNDGAHNRIRINGTGGKTILGNAPCIADECMMWRWTDSDKDDGFCGLAGRPV